LRELKYSEKPVRKLSRVKINWNFGKFQNTSTLKAFNLKAKWTLIYFPLQFVRIWISKNPETRKSQLSSVFDIENPYTIPSDFKPYFIQIGEYEIDATFHYLTIPKMEEKAFLQASVTGWESLNLIQGPANVYFGGAFVGRSEIETYLVEDTLNFSFGRDNKLIVSENKILEFSKKQTFGSNRKDTYAYEISVKNNRAGTAFIDVIDQVPISNDSDIEVLVNELSGGELSEYSGEVKWKLIVPAGEVRKVKISYTIKYPKGKKIRRGRYAKIRSPRYF